MSQIKRKKIVFIDRVSQLRGRDHLKGSPEISLGSPIRKTA